MKMMDYKKKKHMFYIYIIVSRIWKEKYGTLKVYAHHKSHEADRENNQVSDTTLKWRQSGRNVLKMLAANDT